MPGRRRSKPKSGRTPPRHRPAAFPQPTAKAYGQPVQSARPCVTTKMGFTVVPVFDTEAESPPPTLPTDFGSPGTYTLTYVLAVPGCAVVQDQVNFAKLIQAGDSLLEVPTEVHHMHIDLTDGADFKRTAIVNINTAHRLRDIEFEVQADNFAQTASLGHYFVAPLLSRWAFLHDVAITTSAVQIIEAATQVHRWSQLMLGAVKIFSDTTSVSDPDHRILLSAYREGISSTEPLWQALSFFRVAEGVFQMRRTRTAALVAAGQVPADPSERVPTNLSSIGPPNDGGVQESLKPYAGRKFTAVLDEIRPTLRNAIAHLDIDNNVLIQDRWDDLQKVEQALPGLRWIARQLLDSELQEH
jgi:hypothetical protein